MFQPRIPFWHYFHWIHNLKRNRQDYCLYIYVYLSRAIKAGCYIWWSHEEINKTSLCTYWQSSCQFLFKLWFQWYCPLTQRNVLAKFRSRKLFFSTVEFSFGKALMCVLCLMLPALLYYSEYCNATTNKLTWKLSWTTHSSDQESKGHTNVTP